MKSEKKTMVIWVLAILAIILAVILVVVMGKKDIQQTTNNQSTQMAQGTSEQEGVGTGAQADGGTEAGKEDIGKQESTEAGKESTGKQESAEAGKEGTSKQESTEASKEDTGKQESAESGKEDTDKQENAEAGKEGTSKQESTEAGKEDTGKQEETEQPKEETTTPPQTPVADDGSLSPLHLDGTQLCDEAGNPIQLRGISTHGLAWFPKYVNEECFRMFKEEWNANVVRLAMYTAENGGYCTDGNKKELKQLVKDGVAYATNVGLYVIIDWHVLNDRDPNTYKEEAKAFFKEMSAEYKDYTNVIYEVCNEPNGGVSWQSVKSYAEEVIEVIRENDEDAIIIVGTPNWSQYVDQAAADPITTSDNIMYALHFYAATHKNDLRTQMKNAVNNGLPVFVSEYGICDASGNGGIDEGQANEWVEAMDDLGISYIAWNLSNKNETSAIIKSSCNKTSGFTKDDLSTSGKWLYEMLTGKSADDFTPSNTGDNGNQNNNQQSGQNNNQSAPTPTQAPVANISNGNGLDIQAELKDSWSGEGGTSYNYNLTITNNSGKNIDGWKITLQFSDSISSVQGWSGNFSIDGSALHISNVEYNGSIGDGESRQDIGFIVTGSDSLKIK